MFGLYLHSISRHAPQQYEIICLKSVNAEHQERLFGQCRRTAESTTNKHPVNVISNVILRMQTKQFDSNIEDTIVSKAAKSVLEYKGTHIPLEFVQKHKDSWQAHLERISPYLLHGEGVWWKQTENGYMFNDSDDSPASYVVGPQLLHFRDSSMQHVVTRQHLSWEDIIANKTRLPAPSIKVYDCNDTLINIHEHKALDGNNLSADITSNDSVSHTALQPTPSDSNVTMENSINNFELAETTECQTTTINSCAAVSHTTLQSRSSDSISALDNSTELTETTECQTTTSESNDSISSQTTLQPPLLDSNAFGIQHNSDILQLKTKAVAMGYRCN